jgi:tRNA (mo5U34)-methyltransferase
MNLAGKAMNGVLLEALSNGFKRKIENIKLDIDPKFPWHPYDTLSNLAYLMPIFNKHSLEKLIGPSFKTLDIGAADGDLAFFLESLGYRADIIDFPPTNFNHLNGAKVLKEKLNSAVNIYERDLDSQFPTLNEKYGLIFLLGILYHLKNPFYILETLSHITNNLIINTKIAKYTKSGSRISDIPVAYLLSPTESNNDATNYWIFSMKGLERIFDRTGWYITDIYSLGDTKKSNPADSNHDERAFALLKSKNLHA